MSNLIVEVVNRLLPRYHQHQAEAAATKAINHALRESPTPTILPTSREDTTIGNEKTLRGIPVIGRVGGTIPGTQPEHATLRKLA